METTELMLGGFVVYYVLGMIITARIALRGMRSGKLQPSCQSSAAVAFLIVSMFALPIYVDAAIGALLRAWRGR